MFALSLETILKTFNKVEAQLETFLKETRINIQQNQTKIEGLKADNDGLEAEADKATRVLGRVKALTE